MAKVAQHEAMDAETVAGLLGVSTRQLNNYINLKELPSHGEGRRRTFVWMEVLEWYVGYRSSMEMGDGNDGSEDGDFDDSTSVSGPKKPEDIRAANLRKTRAEANLKELQLSRLRGEVITIADAKVRLDRMLGNLRARLLGMAPKLASRLEAEKERTAREAAIKDEMENLCREVSTGAIVDLPPEPEVLEEVSASAAAPEGITDAEILLGVAELLEFYDPFQ